jgi:hypothetical protein
LGRATPSQPSVIVQPDKSRLHTSLQCSTLGKHTVSGGQPDFTIKDDSGKNLASSTVLELSQAGGQGASTPDTERDELLISSWLLDGTAATN